MHVRLRSESPLNFPHISETLITLRDTQNSSEDDDDGDDGLHGDDEQEEDEDEDGDGRRTMIEGGVSARRV